MVNYSTREALKLAASKTVAFAITRVVAIVITGGLGSHCVILFAKAAYVQRIQRDINTQITENAGNYSKLWKRSDTLEIRENPAHKIDDGLMIHIHQIYHYKIVLIEGPMSSVQFLLNAYTDHQYSRQSADHTGSDRQVAAGSK